MSRLPKWLTATLVILILASSLVTLAHAADPPGGVFDDYSAQFDGHEKYIRLCDQQQMLQSVSNGGALVRSYRTLPSGFRLLDTLYGGDCTLYLIQHPSFPLVDEGEYPPIEDLELRITTPADKLWWNYVYDTYYTWLRRHSSP